MTTTSYLLPSEWRALLRNYLIGFAIAAIGLFVGGMRCQAYLAHRPDPAIALEAKHSTALRDTLAAERDRADSIGVILAVTRAQVALDSARAVAAHREADRKTAGIVIDTAVASIALWPAEDSGSSGQPATPDTVTYAAVQRQVIDAKPFKIPRFFVEAYLAKGNESTAYQDLAANEHALNANYRERASIDSTRMVTYDSLNASLSRQVDALSRQGHPWCGFRCGVVTTLTALTAAAIALHEVRR